MTHSFPRFDCARVWRLMLNLLRFRWFAPGLHVLLFAFTSFGIFNHATPLLAGAKGWGFIGLFFADFPISVLGFWLIWGGNLVFGLLLWGGIGTAWWYLIGLWIEGIAETGRR